MQRPEKEAVKTTSLAAEGKGVGLELPTARCPSPKLGEGKGVGLEGRGGGGCKMPTSKPPSHPLARGGGESGHSPPRKGERRRVEALRDGYKNLMDTKKG